MGKRTLAGNDAASGIVKGAEFAAAECWKIGPFHFDTQRRTP
jgi:hypothetical protein